MNDWHDLRPWRPFARIPKRTRAIWALWMLGSIASCGVFVWLLNLLGIK